LTYFPLTKTTVRNNHWSRDEANMNRLTDWRATLSTNSVAHYGFQAELLTNTRRFACKYPNAEIPVKIRISGGCGWADSAHSFLYIVERPNRMVQRLDFDAARVARELTRWR